MGINKTEIAKLNIARKIISGTDRSISRTEDFRLLYPFTTENLIDYYKQFNFLGKTYLTIGSSCAQIFDAILADVASIDVIDTSPFVEEYYNLWVSAILLLSREESINFFAKYMECSGNGTLGLSPTSFSREVYKNISQKIDNPNIKFFWDSLFEEFKSHTIRTFLFRPFAEDTPARAVSKMSSFLLNDENYKKLRERIKQVKVNFTIGDILTANITKTYDNINLSNLVDLVKQGNINTFLDFCERLINNNLNQEGVIMMAYLFYAIGYDDGNGDLISVFRKRFPNMEEAIINSAYNISKGPSDPLYPHFRDVALIYKKTRKNLHL